MSEDTEWFAGKYLFYKPKSLAFPLIVWAVFIGLALAAALYPIYAHAAAIAQIHDKDVSITLYDEPCALAEIKNLGYRATWTEGGKTFQGCWAARADLEIVAAYFDDKTIALIPFGVIKPVKNA